MKKLILLTIIVIYTNISKAQWTQVSTGLHTLRIESFAISDTNIFAGTFDGVCLSTNNGDTWTWTNSGIPAGNIIHAIVIKDTNIFAAALNGGGGVYLSTDNGTSWNNMLGGHCSTLAICDTGVFSVNDGNLYLSTDNGSSWTLANTGLPQNASVSSFVTSGTYTYAGTSEGVYLTTNYGGSWSSVSAGLPTFPLINTLAINGTNIFAGTEYDGIFLSADSGNTWTAVNSGYGNAPVKSFAFSGTNIFVATGNNGGVFLSTDYGNTWAADSFNLPSNALIISDSTIFVGTEGFGVWRRSLSNVITGINEIKKEENIYLYPNPTNGKVTITSKSILKSIKVFNILGEVVYSSTPDNSQSTIEINLPYFSKGIYFIKVDDGLGTHIENFLLN